MTRTETDDLLDALASKLSHDNPAEQLQQAPVSVPTRKMVRKVRQRLPGPPEPPKPPPPSPSDEKPTLFSEVHPNAYKTSRLFIPRLPVVIIFVWTVYAMLANLWRGEYLFMIRWYEQSWILPNLVKVLSSKESFTFWWNNWGPFAMVIIATIVFVGVVLYLFVWRLFFKDYIRYSEGVETNEGRCYWIEGQGALWNIWDLVYYRKKAWPLRETITLYLNTRWLPPNPVSPSRKMLKIQLCQSKGEKLERRGPYQLVGYENPYRRIIGIRQFRTHSDVYTSDPVRVPEAKAVFKERVNALIGDTQALTKANVGVRLDKMKSGTVMMDEELRQMIIHERTKKA